MSPPYWRLPWLWRHRGELDEAEEKLAEVERRADEVDELSAQLQEALKHNHFSELVNEALRRARGDLP